MHRVHRVHAKENHVAGFKGCGLPLTAEFTGDAQQVMCEMPAGTIAIDIAFAIGVAEFFKRRQIV